MVLKISQNSAFKQYDHRRHYKQTLKMCEKKIMNALPDMKIIIVDGIPKIYSHYPVKNKKFESLPFFLKFSYLKSKYFK
jgi:hypothetical protein